VQRTGSTTEPQEPADRTQTIAPRSGEPVHGTDPTLRARGTPEVAHVESGPGAALPVDDPERYRDAVEHARGGLGRVVRARDIRLGRTVAVKELLKKSPIAEQLFVREALITARLQHPGIVPVHEAGRWPSGEPYYVMKLVQGRTLKEVIGQRRTLPERLALLPHVITVAEAIGYAHSEHVIHRDIKPANVVVGDFGETVVVDWGLARDGKRDVPDVPVDVSAESGSGETRTSTVSGKVIGTPQYMPPEQARGDIVDQRADVYALGALLYETLAGQPPYSGPDSQAILAQVLEGPPRALSELVPALSTDLLAIVGKAMCRDPRDRYFSGRELAEDLKRFQTGQLVTAHVYRTRDLLRRWLQRHRGQVAVAVFGSLLLVAIAIGFVRRIVDERNAANRERTRAETALAAASERQQQLVMLQAETSLRRDPTAAVAWLKTYPEDAPNQEALPGLLDEAIAAGVARHVWRERDWVYDAAFTPDGTQIATASKDGDVRLYDVAGGGVRVLGHHEGGVSTVEFSPDGTMLATGGMQGGIRLWNAGASQPGAPIRSLDGHRSQVQHMAFSADGKHLLSEAERTATFEWNVTTGASRELRPIDADMFWIAVAPNDWKRALVAPAQGDLMLADSTGVHTLAKMTRGAAAVAVSHDGNRGVVHDGEQLFSIELVRGGSQLKPLAPYRGHVWSIEFSRDDRKIAVSGDRHEIVLIDVPSGRIEMLRGHFDTVYELAFTRDGNKLLSTSDDGTARVWDLAHGGSRVLRGHEDDVYGARFSPDETMVVTTSFDRSARLWRLDTAEMKVLGGDADAITGLELFDGDRQALIASEPQRASVWNLETGVRTDLFVGDLGPKMRYPVLAAGGRHVALPREDGSIDLWVDGVHRGLPARDDRVNVADFSSDGSVLYTGARNGVVRRWETATGLDRVLIDENDSIYELAAMEDRDQVVVSVGNDVVLLDGEGHRLARGNLGPRSGKYCQKVHATFNPHGDRVAISRCDATATVWTPRTGAMVDLEDIGFWAGMLAFSSDGSRIIGGMADRTVRLWDAETGKLVATLPGHSDFVTAIALSPDGARLASSSYDRTLRVWDLASGASHVLRGHEASVDHVAWTHDGKRLVSASRDGTIRVWRAPPPGPPSPGEARERLHDITTAVIGPDDRPCTSGV
jgi:eukaryotic-like serine/threonine-protein kinase